MPRSSFSENPLLRVSRPVSACSRCRANKVKCDGKLPACTACEKAGRENECSSANDEFARGKERSYVAALELRVEKLEGRLAYARSRKASVTMHQEDAPPPSAHDNNDKLHGGSTDKDRRDSLATIRAAIHRKAARKRENSDVNSLISDFGYLSVNATTRDFEPSVSNMTFARLVLAAASNDPLPTMAQLQQEEEADEAHNGSHDESVTRLPSRQYANALVQYYMSNMYALYPAFNETTLYTVLDDVYLQQQSQHQQLAPNQGGYRPPIKDADYWLLYMVLAIASTMQSRAITGDVHYRRGVSFVVRALPYADRALMPGYPTQIQSLVLLTQYSMFDPAHFDSWHLIGFTCRAVVDLGFHQDPPPAQQPEKAVLDLRRKTFWCVYALDRSISMVHARAFSFTDDAINVDFPSMSGMGRIPSISGPITGPQSADPAILLFQLRRLQSHWYQTLFQSDPRVPLPGPDLSAFVWQSCQEMREWAESLPDTLPTGIRELFDLELRYSYVYCIAPSARIPQMTDYGRVLIFEHAIAYLDHVYDSLARLQQDQPHDQQQQGEHHQQFTDPLPALGPATSSAAFYTYHDALRVYFMASQFVAVLRDAEDVVLSADVQPAPVPTTLPGMAPPPPLPPRLDSLTGSHFGSQSRRQQQQQQQQQPQQPQTYHYHNLQQQQPPQQYQQPYHQMQQTVQPRESNTSRSLRTLARVGITLATFGARWEDALALRDTFALVSADMLESLKLRASVEQTLGGGDSASGGSGGGIGSGIRSVGSSAPQSPSTQGGGEQQQQYHGPQKHQGGGQGPLQQHLQQQFPQQQQQQQQQQMEIKWMPQMMPPQR